MRVYAVMFLEMADDGLNGGMPFELALDPRRDAALLAARVDLELVFGRGVVTAIVGIGDAAIEHGPVPPPPGLAALLDATLAFN